jgi:hypothetical protein
MANQVSCHFSLGELRNLILKTVEPVEPTLFDLHSLSFTAELRLLGSIFNIQYEEGLSMDLSLGFIV